jgi:hypothetical protein
MRIALQWQDAKSAFCVGMGHGLTGIVSIVGLLVCNYAYNNLSSVIGNSRMRIPVAL